MKSAMAVLWQAVVLFIAAWAGFIAGMVSPAVRIQRVVSQTPTAIRTYDYDWIIAVLVVYLLLIVIGALRKRLRESLVHATAALIVVVAVLLLFTQIGIKETSLVG